MVTKSSTASRIKFLAFILLIGSIIFNVLSCGSDSPNLPKGISTNWTEIDWSTDYSGFTYQNLTPSCSAAPKAIAYDKRSYPNAIDFGPNFTFFVKGGKSNNIVIFLEDGGACWHTMNCLYAHTYQEDVSKIQLETGNAPKRSGVGLLDTANEKNPFKDWFFVYVPYCTGDYHIGANDAQYPDFSPKKPYGGGMITIRHRGEVNFQLVLQWIKDKWAQKGVDQPEKILVTGSDAGSYGSIFNFPYVADAFPTSKAYQLGDAGIGVVPNLEAAPVLPIPDALQPLAASQGVTLVDKNSDIRPTFETVWKPILPTSVTGYTGKTYKELTTVDFYAETAKSYPDSRFAQYTTVLDKTQVFYYFLQGYSYISNQVDPLAATYAIPTYPYMINKSVLMAIGPANWQASLSAIVDTKTNSSLYNLIVGLLWKPRLVTYVETIAATVSNYQYYVGLGTRNMINTNETFYSEVSGGPWFIDWLTAMLDPKSTTWVSSTQAF